MIKLKIKTSLHTYPVMIGSAILNELLVTLNNLNLNSNLFIVIDENVFKYHKSLLNNAFENYGKNVQYYILPAGEESKSEKYLKNIYNSLLKNDFGRDTTLLAIGGGVTGDISAYAASTYMRGIDLVHIPTTLLAMIDSSIGGKTAINFSKNKNVIGIKESSGNLIQVSEIASMMDLKKFTLLSGDDSLTLPILSVGGHGVISVLANIAPRPVNELCTHYMNGRTAKAAQIHWKILPLFKALFCETNPAPVKTAMEILGICSSELRLPLCKVSSSNKLKIAKALKEFGLNSAQFKRRK